MAAGAVAHGAAVQAYFEGRALLELWRGRRAQAARAWRGGLRAAERHGCALDAAAIRVCLASLEPKGPRRAAALAPACEALERAGLVAPAAWARRVEAGAAPFGPETLRGAPSDGPDSRSVNS
eukprot:tig00020556_g11005.t1